MGLIQQVSMAENPQQISKVSLEPFSERSFASVVALFERQYWVRLWVVQEVFSAQDINVHCGPMKLPWEAFQAASRVFKLHRDMLERRFRPGYSNNFYQPRSGSYPQLLVHAGPGSLAGVGTPAKFRDLDKLPDRAAFQDLLAVLRTCRSKLTSDPRDKVFGMLGVLSERVRREIKVDYGLSVKDVYIGIFRTVVDETKSLDILCDSIHFPTYTNNNNLPSWVPDWSHVTPIAPITMGYEFRASGKLQAVVDFTERNKLRISAVPLGIIKECGTAVGTLCTVHDYLMAFLHWRACFLDAIDGEKGEKLKWYLETFCLTLGLWHVPRAIEKPKVSVELCHHIFASMIRDRLPKLAMDRELESYTDMDFGMDYNERRQLLQDHFGSKMMGRCFCMTHERLIGMGTGFMTRGDIIVVPLGCSTPVVLRPDDDGYRFVGDVYISGYMHGRAVSESEAGDPDRDIRSYVLH
ncbi:hypothetical protein Daus18300_007250 [Diaporthe australafricana]|uniref:Heterokaryon incompatibility domain-containing protein n=1 Tax=Diaporthe australafricana TaxID=127596 RepID=A0ABR3WNX0_9PEZI